MTTELLAALKAIKTYPPRLDQGICGNLRTTVGDEKWKVMDLHLKSMFERWPESSGDRFFPVEKREQYLSDASQRKLWDNPRRIALLDWLIKELEDG